jgi:hypothetical protein
MNTIHTKIKRFAAHFGYSLLAIALLNAAPSRALAQEGHAHTATTQQAEAKADAAASDNALIQAVQNATERYKNVGLAQADGYALQFGCVSGDDFGAMGLHYINGDLINSGVIDVNRPQIVIYEPTPDGGRKLIGADYLVFADQWNAKHASPPQLMGQIFHLFTAPNRFGLPAFYTLHVWAWKQNPKGAFVNWHSNVSCEAFNGQ